MVIPAFTSQQIEELATRYKSGTSLQKLANEYGVARKTVHRALEKRQDIEFRRQGPYPTSRRDPNLSEHVVGLYEAGESQERISETLGIAVTTIRRILRDASVEMRGNANKGDKHWAWKGGTALLHGYRLVYPQPEDQHLVTPMSTGYVLEHRLVMARTFGRRLTKHETVHHINGDKLDNRPENLQLRSGQHGMHVKRVCGDCGSGNVIAVPLD